MTQLSLPFRQLQPRDPVSIVAGGRTFVLRYARHPRARRYVLRLGRDGALVVTVPRGGSRAQALAFVRSQTRWIERQRYRRDIERSASVWKAGTEVWLRGVRTRIGVGTDLGGVTAARLGEVTVRIPGRHADDLRPLLERCLRALAARELPPRLRELAAAHGLDVARVTIRSQRSLWGSCAPGGRISLNWRLVLMPPVVRDYILLHELMHLREANHTRRFWRLLDRACPDHAAARRWLKDHGQELL